LTRKKLSIAIPASVVSDIPHFREKTSRMGLIGRAAAIFRVGEIIIYPDNPRVNQKADMNFLAMLLNYMETPQYLRKKLFKLRSELRYAGVLPPLRTPHHPLNRKKENLKVGEYREGVTLSKTKGGTLIDIGVENPALIQGKLLPLGKRFTIKIMEIKEKVLVELANPDEIPTYWGYKVTVEKNSLGKLVKSGIFDLTIATSKYGVPFADVAEEIREKWKNSTMVLVVFGAPTLGLYEILKNENLSLDDVVDYVVNTVPKQGTETIRTEEALLASLAIFNMKFCFEG